MTRNIFTKAMVVVAMMAMFTVNANAQYRGRHDNNFNHRGERMMDGPRGGHHPGYHMAPPPPAHHGYHMAPPPPPRVVHVVTPRFDRYGYLPGWEGSVRYLNGRYGYLRGNDWYWYDTYYEPDYYYAHPVGHFHHVHLTREGKAIVTAVAGAAIIGGVVAALAH